LAPDGHAPSRDELIAFVSRHGNDLEAPAIASHPAIAEALAALQALRGCRLARMSGSGASCFALFDSNRAAVAAARALRIRNGGSGRRCSTDSHGFRFGDVMVPRRSADIHCLFI
jgi:4-diphosphocytidyl-2C-methyl-D-erythritol kinase